MKIFKKNKNIQFNINSSWKYIHDNYAPQPASKFKHEWLKHPPPAKCPGFADLYKQGYVLPMWFDLDIELQPANTWEEKEVMLTSNSAKEFCSWHFKEVASIHPHLSNHNFFHSILKIHSPWQVKVPKGYSILQIPPWFHYDRNWEITPGMLNASFHHSLIFPMFLRLTRPIDQSSFIHLRAGEPLAIIIPIERENLNLNLTMDDKEVEDNLNYFKQAIALRKDTHKMYREMDDLPPGMAPSAKVYREMDDKDNA
tara:strand:- start:747 stop:1511 length:765 start_codon:yes stop_codon:yes gene_type:complete